MSLWRMFKYLDMNDNRITFLGPPKASADAATKRWVNQQLEDREDLGGSEPTAEGYRRAHEDHADQGG